MSNRFRDPMMRGIYEAMMTCFRTRHRDLIHASGARHRGNSAATYFWRGYDGVTKPVWDASSRQTTAYACYRAGQDIKRFVEAGVYDPVPAAPPHAESL